MSATSQQSPVPAFGAAHQAAAAAESAKRIDALRQRLEQYNAAIAQAMGMQGGASGGANDEEDDDDDDEYTDDTDEDEPRAGGGAGAAFDVEDYIRQFKQHAAASAADPGTASRPLFTDSYREESLPAGNAAVEPDSSEYTDTTEEEYEEVTDSEANYHSFEEEEEEDDDGGEPRLNSAVVPPWLRGAMFPNHASSPPKPAPVVDRCLNSELRQAAASVGSQQQATTSPLDAANSPNDTVLTAGTTAGGLAASQRINSPNPDEPSYSFRDLENAYHRITKIEQSVKKLSAFGMLEPRLPYADRVQQLREERVRLLQEESVLASESRELQSLVLPELAESDTNTHHDMQSLLQVCKSEKIYKAVHDRIKVIELKQTGLTDKVKRMQDTFSNLQRKKQLSTSSDTHNSNEATRLKDGLASLAKNKTEIDRLEKESSSRTEEVSGIQKKVDNWLAVLKDRDRNLDERSAKMQHLGEQLQRRQEVLMSHKENRRP